MQQGGQVDTSLGAPRAATVAELLTEAEQARLAGRAAESEALCRRILKVDPDQPEALNLLALHASQAGQLETAIEHLRRAVAAAPRVALFHGNLCEVLRRAGRFDEAVASGRAATALDPALIDALSNLALALTERGDHDEALTFFNKVIALDPDRADAHGNLGQALFRMRRYDESAAALRAQLALDPTAAAGWANLGTALDHDGRYDECVAALRRAIALDYDQPNAHTSLGIALLRRGEFAEGWDEYESRLQTELHGGNRLARPWRGESLAGKRIYVSAEQGFGDTIQFARYIPLLAARSAGVSFRVQNSLTRLMRHSLPGIEILGDGETSSAYHCDCELLSLAKLFRTRLETIPAPVGYLRADDAATATWRDRFGRDGFKIGLVWAGQPKHNNDLRRSIDPAAFRSLFDVPGVRFFSLQVGPRAAELASVPDAKITDHTALIGDYADTAAAVAALDLVITIDSSVAHLAAAMGRPTWLLLPWVFDWRWLFDRSDSPWYPTMRIVRQREGQAWADVIAGLAPDLAAVAAGDAAALTPFRAAGERRAAVAAELIAIEGGQQMAQAAPMPCDAGLPDLLRLAEPHRLAGRIGAFPALCERFLRLKLDEPAALHRLGIMAHQAGRLDLAIAYLRHAVALAPQVALYHADLGEMWRLFGNAHDAIAEGRRALALQPDFPEALNNVGIALFDRGAYHEAIDHYRRAVALRPDYADAFNNIGNAQQMLKRYDDAVASYRRALELRPDFLVAQGNLATALASRGQADAQRPAAAVAPDTGPLVLPTAGPAFGRKLAFVLAAADHGTMIVSRLDYLLTQPGSGIGVGYQILESGAFDAGEVSTALRVLDLRRQYFGDGVVAIDGGANIGVHTIEWAKHMTGWGSVLAIEAQERIYYALAGNIAINNCFNAAALNAAISSAPGSLKVPQPDYLTPASFGSLELRQSGHTEFIGQTIDYSERGLKELQAVTIDSLDLPRIDFIKIDVEGMEMEALAGAAASIDRCRPAMLVEAIKTDATMLRDWLTARDYAIIAAGINFLAVHASDPILPHFK